MTPVAETALAWHDAGFCVLPAAPDGSKRPALAWARYQKQRPGREEVAAWTGEADGIGLVCGAVSGGLELLELEGRAVADGLHEELLHLLGEVDQGLITKLMSYVESTPSGGLHWLYRVEGVVPGNTKLARRRGASSGAVDVLIETRGEGGWTIAGGSGGRTHPTGRPWEIIAGRPGVVPTLTADEHATLHRIARLFDEMPDIPAPAPAPAEHRGPGERSPGDEFNETATWPEILGPYGWVAVGHRGEVTLWRRPGKNSGVSATTGYGDGDWFYVFSTSTEFDSERTYTKFGTLTVLGHRGDHGAASKALRGRGYGDPLPTERVLTLIHGEGRGGEGGAPDGAIVRQLDPVPQQVLASLTDVGNATLLIARHGHELRYVPERGSWLTWGGVSWEWAPDDSPAVQAVIHTVQAIEPANDAERKWQQRSLNYRPIQAAVLAARSNPTLQARLVDLDADPYALNTPTGVVDLRTGVLTASRPEQLHTRLTGVPYDPEAPCPRWLTFLAETFGADAELINFMQRLIGYAVTGVVTHHVLPFFHGSGGNGKSVLIETVLSVVGDYGTTAPPDFLLAGGREDESATARLVGQRLVACSEVNPRAHFNESKIKQLTGGDTITARFLYGSHFTFTPTHQLILSGNHQPQVEAGGESFWRRVRLVPFTHTVPAELRIEGLSDDLVAAEGPGILAWIIRGARQCLSDGLKEPSAVLVATTEYEEEEDQLGRFAEARLRFGGGGLVRIEMREMRNAYEQWCFSEGEKPISTQLFGRELRRFSVGLAKSNGRRFYTNVTLMRDESGPEDRRPEQLRWNDQ